MQITVWMASTQIDISYMKTYTKLLVRVKCSNHHYTALIVITQDNLIELMYVMYANTVLLRQISTPLDVQYHAAICHIFLRYVA